jgi:hypothetical protein
MKGVAMSESPRGKAFFSTAHGDILTISKLVEVDVSMPFVHLDQMKDGTWRLTYAKSLAKDNIVLPFTVVPPPA